MKIQSREWYFPNSLDFHQSSISRDFQSKDFRLGISWDAASWKLSWASSIQTKDFCFETIGGMCCKCAEIANKPSIEGSKAMETSHLMYNRSCRLVNNCLNLIFIHEHSFGRHNIPQNTTWSIPKLHFFLLSLNFSLLKMSSTSCKCTKQILQTKIIHQNFIKIHHNSNPQ